MLVIRDLLEIGRDGFATGKGDDPFLLPRVNSSHRKFNGYSAISGAKEGRGKYFSILGRGKIRGRVRLWNFF